LKDKDIKRRAKQIKFLLTDCDGVLTDTGVYYSANGEELKRFSIRDGMGVERLRKITGIETGIVTRENSGVVVKRAGKLGITDIYTGCKDKAAELEKIMALKNLAPEEIAYIGDDVNDIEILGKVGLSACPSDALQEVKSSVLYECENCGGNGAFREFAELIINAQSKKKKQNLMKKGEENEQSGED
jgi:3-deoxy-D-manno-octulosonate 8-phosphate phosphatase (KDO 8-P phosphatase)